MSKVKDFEYYFRELSDNIKHKDPERIEDKEFKKLIKHCLIKMNSYSHASMLIDIRNILKNKESKKCYIIPTLDELCVKLLSKSISESDRHKAIRSLSMNVLEESNDLSDRDFDIERIKHINKIHYDTFKRYINTFDELIVGMKVIIDDMSDINVEIEQIKENIKIQQAVSETAQQAIDSDSDINVFMLNVFYDDFVFEPLSNDIEGGLRITQYELINRMCSNDESIDFNQIIEKICKRSQMKIFLLNLFIDSYIKFIKVAVNKNELINDLSNLTNNINLKEIIISKINQNN